MAFLKTESIRAMFSNPALRYDGYREAFYKL